jgi:hypothetical protein
MATGEHLRKGGHGKCQQMTSQFQLHKLKKFGFDRTRINEVVGIFADCEGSEPEGERASQSAAEKSEAHNDDRTESHQSEDRPVGTGKAAR